MRDDAHPLDAGANAPAVSGDALSLQQLVLNMLDNALHVSSPGAEVTVALAAATTDVTVTVSDEGPGIEPDQLERIFDRFYSRSRPSARPVPGWGSRSRVRSRATTAASSPPATATRPAHAFN